MLFSTSSISNASSWSVGVKRFVYRIDFSVSIEKILSKNFSFFYDAIVYVIETDY